MKISSEALAKVPHRGHVETDQSSLSGRQGTHFLKISLSFILVTTIQDCRTLGMLET